MRLRTLLSGTALACSLLCAAAILAQDTPGPGAGTPGPGKGKGAKGKSKAPSQPAPRNKDGRVSLGPGAAGTGFWGGGGSIIGGAGNLALEAVPFQPWARSLY